jgi:hypothetical protein
MKNFVPHSERGTQTEDVGERGAVDICIVYYLVYSMRFVEMKRSLCRLVKRAIQEGYITTRVIPRAVTQGKAPLRLPLPNAAEQERRRRLQTNSLARLEDNWKDATRA